MHDADGLNNNVIGQSSIKNKMVSALKKNIFFKLLS